MEADLNYTLLIKNMMWAGYNPSYKYSIYIKHVYLTPCTN